MDAFLTVTEAAKHTGKSPSSIRRLFYGIKDDPTHPDRHHVQPNPDEVVRLRQQGVNFAWRVSEEFLHQKISIDDPGKKGTESSSARPSGDGNATLISMLQRELEIKNTQIAQQSEIIEKQLHLNEGLSERLREENILIQTLQKQLTLLPATTRSNIVDAQTQKSAEWQSESKKPSKTTNKAPKPKRGFFRRLFS